MGELGIATLTAAFVNANRDPKKSQAAKPQDYFYFDKGKNSQYTAEIANTVFSLAKDRKLPPWALSILPVAELRKLKNQDKPKQPRLWIANEVLLFNPMIVGNKVGCDLAIIQSKPETPLKEITLKDVDKGFKVIIYVPSYEEASTVILDALFDLIA